MPREQDEVHGHFDTVHEKYTEEKNGKALFKQRTLKTCKFGCGFHQVYRNVETLQSHLAAPDFGIGRDSGCSKADLAVRDKYRAKVAQREMDKEKQKSKEVHRLKCERADKESKRARRQSNQAQPSIDSSLSVVKVSTP
jgi:hypothetical protein